MDDQLYREELMDIYKNNTNKGKLSDASVEVFEKNPMCGDEITLQLKMEDGKIVDAKYDGPACSVSVISSNYLLNYLKGKTLDEAKSISRDQLIDMIGLNLTTSRIKCATLSLEALTKAIQKYEQGN